MPLVSVILSTYNWNHSWLEESIKSVLNQSFTDFEFIILDDASQNNIKNVILKYQKIDHRIVYIQNDTNLWLTKSLNKWIKLSIWKYIARIDDDDIWYDKNKLKSQVVFMENNPLYWLCWTSTILIDEDWNTIDKITNRLDDLSIRSNLLGSNQFTHSSIIIRKLFLEKVNWYIDSKKTKYIEDYDLWLRLWKNHKMHNLINFSTKYRINKNSISNSKSFHQNLNALFIIFQHLKHFPNPTIGIIKHLIILFFPKKILNKLIKISKS